MQKPILKLLAYKCNFVMVKVKFKIKAREIPKEDSFQVYGSKKT